MRSLNTSLTTLLPVAALLFVGAGLFGANTLKDLALALFVGILAGTYSSIFVATPLLTMMKEQEPRYRGLRERVERSEARATSKQQRPADQDEPSERPEQEEPAEVSVTTDAAIPRRSPASRPAGKPRAGSKKKRRRKR